eukprot:m.219463 g.219463  ORF g.219463 m.219463 type:complete len:833 (-) comp17233_c0_seq5:1895-4393(-)
MGKAQSKKASRESALDDQEFGAPGDSLPIQSRSSQRFAAQNWLQDGVVEQEVTAFLKRLPTGHFVAYREAGRLMLGLSNGDGTVRHELILFVNNTSCRLEQYPDEPVFESLNFLVQHYQEPDAKPFSLVEEPEVMDLMLDYSQEALVSNNASVDSLPPTPRAAAPLPQPEVGTPQATTPKATTPQVGTPQPASSPLPGQETYDNLGDAADPTLNESVYGEAVISSLDMQPVEAIIVEEGYGDIQRPVDQSIEMSDSEDEELPLPPRRNSGFMLLTAAIAEGVDDVVSPPADNDNNDNDDGFKADTLTPMPQVPERPSLAAGDQGNGNVPIGMPAPLDLDAIAENAGVDEEDVAYLRPAMAGVAPNEGGNKNDTILSYQRLPDDHPNDIFHWARDTDPLLKDGAIQPLWIHSTQLDRNKAESLISSFGGFPGLFLIRARKPRTSKDKAVFCISLRGRKGFEHHLISRKNDIYYMAGSNTLPPIQSASDLSSILMQVSAKMPGILHQAITIPRLSREDVGGFPDFFHGKIDRREAVRRLMTDGQGKEGYYLVRVSARAGPAESASGEATFVLSCISKLAAAHHVLKRQASGVWVLNDDKTLPKDCVSLPDVLAYFMERQPKVSFVLRSYVRRPPLYRLARYASLGDDDGDMAGLPPPLEPPMRGPVSPGIGGVVPPALPKRNASKGSSSEVTPSGSSLTSPAPGTSQPTVTAQAQQAEMDTFAALAARANQGDNDDNDDEPFGRPQSQSYADANQLFGDGDELRMQAGDMVVEGNPGAPPLMIPNLDEPQDLHQSVGTMQNGGKRPSAGSITFGFDNADNGADNISLGSDIEFM